MLLERKLAEEAKRYFQKHVNVTIDFWNYDMRDAAEVKWTMWIDARGYKVANSLDELYAWFEGRKILFRRFE